MDNVDGPPSMMRMQGYDPSSRYDPATMSRVVDVEVDELDDDLADFGEYEIREIRTRGKAKRAFIALICLCALAGIGVGIAMGVSNGGGGNKALAAVCAPDAVSTTKGYAKCRASCADADCCNLPADDSLSCAGVKGDTCKKFNAHCAILAFDHNNDGKVEVQELVQVPPADPSINLLCEWDNLATTDGYMACKDACQPGNCCYEKIETCKVTNPDMCNGYEGCEILHVQDLVTIPPALPNIEDLCSPESLDTPAEYNKCKAACDPGECCAEPIETCKVENPEMCGGYEMCDILHGTPKTHPTSVESQVVTKCNTGALSSAEGMKECQDICEPALCCFHSIDDSNKPNRADAEFTGACNTPENKDWCSQYSACQTLQHVDEGGVDSRTDAKAVVEEACSDPSPDGLEICGNVCAPAQCCFDGTVNCFEDGPDSLRCSDYLYCGILYHNDKDPTTSVNPNPIAVNNDQESMMDIAEQAEKVCSMKNLATPDGQDECLNLCQDNFCCFASGDTNCMQEHAELCVVYASCGNFINGKNSPDLESPKPIPIKNASAENPKSVTDDLAEMCEVAKLQTQEGFANCHDMCKNHLCCFSTDEMENCYLDHPTECDDYAPCGELVMAGAPADENANKDNDLTKEVVDEVCDASSLQSDEGLANCHAMCAKHLCCFSPSGTKSNCVDTMGSAECNKHAACANLITDEAGTDISAAPDSLEYLCSEDYVNNKGSDDCEIACDERQCCFADGPGGCRVTDEAFCEEADLCFDEANDEYEDIDPLSMGTEEEEDEINAACSNNNLKTEQGKLACRDMCDPYKCCWTMVEENNCSNDLPQCKTYKNPCMRLGGELVGMENMDGMSEMNGSGDPEPLQDPEIQPVEVTFTENLETICSDTSLKTDYGLELCREACLPHSCCFDENVETSCSPNNQEECMQYGPCTNLHEFEGEISQVQSATPDEISNVQDTCDKEYLDLNGRSQCEHHCEPRACCFTDNMQLNCFEEERSWCKEFDECKILKTQQSTTSSNNTPVNVYKELKDVCSEEAIAEDKGQSCIVACEPNECCYVHGPKGCYDGNEQLCAQFQICTNLFTAVP